MLMPKVENYSETLVNTTL